MLAQSVSMTCVYRDQEGKEVKTYIKDGAVRSDFTGQTSKDTGSVIMTEQKMYFWTLDKEGFTMDLPTPSVTPEQPNPGTETTLSQKEKQINTDLFLHKKPGLSLVFAVPE